MYVGQIKKNSDSDSLSISARGVRHKSPGEGSSVDGEGVRRNQGSVLDDVRGIRTYDRVGKVRGLSKFKKSNLKLYPNIFV